MAYKAGQKVITPDDEQGFVSAVYADGIFDVDILDDKGEDTTSIEYHISDGVHIAVDQTPQLRDITPLGRVRGIHILREGILAVTTDGHAGLWLSNERVAYLDGRINLTFHHWASKQKAIDFEEVLTYFDLEEQGGHLVDSPIRHNDIAEDCKLEVIFENGGMQTWNAAVNGDGHILSVETPNGEIKLLGELRDTGIIEATLVSHYGIKDF